MKMNDETKSIIVEFYKKAIKDIKVVTPSDKCSCGGTFKKREGKYGTFYGCDNFPECRETKKPYELEPYIQGASVQWVNDCRMVLADLGIKASIRDVVKVIEDKNLPSLMEIESKKKHELKINNENTK